MNAKESRPWRVVWSGNEACRDLAELLADDRALRAGTDTLTTLTESRATLHVTPQLPSVERCSVAVPHNVTLGTVDQVVATVGGGPHSLLAAAAARRAAQRLGVPGRILTGYRRPDQRSAALRALAHVAAESTDLPMEAVHAEHPIDLVASLPAGAMVVVGAPGGSWFQRQFFGPGVRLRVAAPGGVVVVRQDVCRVYQAMNPPMAVGSHMRIRNVLEVTTEPVILVADHGRLTGTVRRSQLLAHPSHIEVGTIADPAVSVAAVEPIEHIWLVLEEHNGGPVGVVTRTGRLIGTISAADLSAGMPKNRERAS
jgi:CBS domain-containing protein